jgi:hypothetical protein
MPSASFILPAQSLHTHGAKFVPCEAGQLHIRGCVIKFSACKLQEFPILDERTRRQREAWYDTRGGELKTKKGRFTLPNSRVAPETDSPADHVGDEGFWPRRTIDATVLPPRPVLVVEQCSVQDNCIMLLEGEM